MLQSYYCSAPWLLYSKTKGDSAFSSEVSPVIDSTNSRSRIEVNFLKKENSLYAAFISGLQWSGVDNTKVHITLSMPNTQAFSLRNQEIKLLHLSVTKIKIIIAFLQLIILPSHYHSFSWGHDISLTRGYKSHLVFRAELIVHGEKYWYVIPSKLVYFFQ